MFFLLLKTFFWWNVDNFVSYHSADQVEEKTWCLELSVSCHPPHPPPPEHPVTEIGGNFIVPNGSWAYAQPKLNKFCDGQFLSKNSTDLLV